jgi:hypothetical protein
VDGADPDRGWPAPPIDPDTVRPPLEPAIGDDRAAPAWPDEEPGQLRPTAEKTKAQIDGLAAAAIELRARLERLDAINDIEGLRPTLVRIEKAVDALADARHGEEDSGETLARLGANLSVFAEVTLPSHFHQLNQTLADSEQERRRQVDLLGAGLDQLQEAWANRSQEEERSRLALNDRLDMALQSLYSGLDRLNDTVAALADREDHERQLLHGRLDQINQALAQQEVEVQRFLQAGLDQLKQDQATALADQEERDRLSYEAHFDQLNQAISAGIVDERRRVTERLDLLISEVERLRRRVALRGRPAAPDSDAGTPMARPADRQPPKARAPRPLQALTRSQPRESLPAELPPEEGWQQGQPS